MQEVGTVLREAREARSLTIDDATAETRIPAKYLKAMEEGRVQALPSPVIARGYLNNYARYLQLDPKPLLSRLEMEVGHMPPPPVFTPEPVRNADPIESDSPFFDPVNVEVNAGTSDGRGVDSWLRIVIIIALIIAIGLVGSRFFLNGESDRGEVAIADTVAELLNQDGEPTPIPIPTAGIVQGSAPFTSTGRTGVDAVGETTATRPRPELPPVMETVELLLEITERTWLQVLVDGEVQYEGLARQGDVFEFTGESAGQNEIVLTTGNAAGIFATVNGVEIGRLGDRGEVVEETWQTTQ